MGEISNNALNKQEDSIIHLDNGKTSHKINFKPQYPWLSISTSLLFISFLLVSNIPSLNHFYQIPETPNKLVFSVASIICIGIIYLLEVRLIIRRNKIIEKQFNSLNRQLSIVSLSKKKQQQKANTYSDHSAKLKTFISDKLLEYMEYDEKFVHFKGIASEVRHNGVISYDKVMTALNKAIQQQHFLALYEQSDQNEEQSNNHTINALTDYQSALDAMRYLWDLLDLSTADNMALHIGNKLIESEEHYYQLQLDANQTLDITQSIPVSPTFNPQLAVLMTFSLILDDIEIKNFIAMSKINETILDKPFSFESEQFKIVLQPTPELLGNHNHIVLLLENLIKNAQFFTNKNRYKQKLDRIKVQLLHKDNYAHFSIYNRGPQIKSEDHEQIFKLGYSTRKNKQHHGKGLGLFFVNEIVKGYQGTIQAINIDNLQCEYLLTLNLASGELAKYHLFTQLNDDKMQVKQEKDDNWLNELCIQQDIPIASIEISIVGNNNVINTSYQSEPIERKKEFSWPEPENNLLSQWEIQVKTFKKQHKLTFKPMDIRGVCFKIDLPTAASHLDE